MVGYTKMLLPRVETILVISCCILLATGLPLHLPVDNSEQEIKLSASPGENCKTPENLLNSTNCLIEKMQRLGYLRKNTQGVSSVITSDELRQAIRDYQEAFNIPVTGVLDSETATKMINRCPVADRNDNQMNTKRRKRYALNGSKWGSNQLTWCIDDADLTPDMSKEEQKNAIRDAFQMWADNSQLSFTEVSNCRSSVIHIKFAVGDHGDNDPFDGPHGTLAHAYFPRFGGDAHFDDDEQWALHTWQLRNGGKLLLPIATHEFGHSLGLGHSRDETAIMYALYFGSNPVVKLQPDDIAGIQYLYGAPSQPATQRPQTQRPQTPQPRPQTPQPRPWTPQPQTPQPRPWTPQPQTPQPRPWTPQPQTPQPRPQTPQPPVRALCTDVPRLDAMVMLGDGYTYGFSGNVFWRMDSSQAIDQVPVPVSQRWNYWDPQYNTYRGLEGNFDAVLFVPTSNCVPQCIGNTFFFSGSYVYYQTGTDGTSGSVQRLQISQVFQGLPNDIDAATLWTGNNKAYFFKGNQYWRVSSINEQPPYSLDQVNWPYDYPRPIDQYWELGWPSVDSAIYYWHYNRPDIKKTYFFRGNQYVRYNDINGRIDNNYPKITEINWYGCKRNGFIQDGDTQGTQMIEQESFMDTDVMDIEVIDIRDGMELSEEEGENTSSANRLSSIGSLLILVFGLCASMGPL